MNIVLWIVQIVLALLFLFAGASKFIMSAEQMAEAGGPDAVQLPMWFVHIIGACEILGALGLVVPWASGVKRGLTPLAAGLLIVIMIGAVVVSAIAAIQMAIFPAVVGLLLAFVAVYRSKQLR